MSISKLSATLNYTKNITFGDNKPQKPEKKVKIPSKKVVEATTKPIKKEDAALKAIASAFIPGLGQFLDGRDKAGTKYLGGEIATEVVGLGGLCLAGFSLSSLLIAAENGITKGRKLKSAGAVIGGLVTVGSMIALPVIHIKNIVDAYRGNKN